MKIKRKTELVSISEKPANQWDFWRDGVTQSILSRWMQCPEKSRLALMESLTGFRTSGALAFGSLVHEVLDQTYSAFMSKRGEDGTTKVKVNYTYDSVMLVVRDALRELEAKDRQAIIDNPLSDPDALQAIEVNHGMAEVVLEAYFKRWLNDMQRFEWISLEEIFRVPYRYPDDKSILIRGKFDGVMRINGGLWLFETKTKAVIEESAIVDKLAYEIQVMLYLWAIEKTYGERPIGVVYNLIRRPQLRQGKSETLRDYLQRIRMDIADPKRTDFYFMRYEAFITKEERALWEVEFNNMMKMFRLWAEGAYNYKSSHECNGKYGVCEFFPICSRGDRSNFQKRTEIFPELQAKE